MKTYAQLERELADARAEIRWLRAEMTPKEDFRYRTTKLSRSEAVVLYALANAQGYLTPEQLLTRVEFALGKSGECAQPKAMAVIMSRLRKRLLAETPPIIIKTDWGYGYSLDDENRALALSRFAGQRKEAA